MKIRKSNILTILTLIFSIIMMTLLPLPTVEAANFTVSKNNVTIENGKSLSITINASTHTGRLDIISSNSSVATASDSSLWVENNSKTITISAKGAGTAKITIKGELYDADTEEEKEFVQTINITVNKKPESSGSNNTGGNSNGTTGGMQNSGSSGSAPNNNQSSKPVGNNNSGSKPSTTNKPVSGGTSNSASSGTKPSNSSPTTANKPAQNNISEEPITIQENNTEVISDEIENLTSEEGKVEEVQPEIVNVEKKEEIEDTKEDKLNSKTILVSIIGVIALAMIFVGIGVSKNILKRD